MRGRVIPAQNCHSVHLGAPSSPSCYLYFLVLHTLNVASPLPLRSLAVVSQGPPSNRWTCSNTSRCLNLAPHVSQFLETLGTGTVPVADRASIRLSLLIFFFSLLLAGDTAGGRQHKYLISDAGYLGSSTYLLSSFQLLEHGTTFPVEKDANDSQPETAVCSDLLLFFLRGIFSDDVLCSDNEL